MESFDRSLKHLLALAPDEVLGFGLGQQVQVIRAVSPTLPGRGREVDGCYLIESGGQALVMHVEFHRRHQAQEAANRRGRSPTAAVPAGECAGGVAGLGLVRTSRRAGHIGT